MAKPNAAGNSVPNIHLEAVLTVPPIKVTDPMETRHLSAAAGVPIGQSSLLKGCLNILLCYNKAVEEDSGWVVAGWIKESLGKALKEQPMISGRLKRRSGEDGDDHELEIVSNDSGARLFEAKIETSLKDFVELMQKDAELEGELVYWKEIDEQNPQFSPLFYVQVTNFECGGYSIGISCSLLLADLIINEQFLQKWSEIQKTIFSENEALKVPIFYLPNLKPPNFTSIITTSPSKNKSSQTIFFKNNLISGDMNNTESIKNLSLLCIDEAEKKIGTKMVSEFSFLVKESNGVMRVLEDIKGFEVVDDQTQFKNQVCVSSWDDLGMKEIAFYHGNKPLYVSHWIGSISDGFVMAFHHKVASEVTVLVTIPGDEKKIVKFGV